MKTYTVQVSSTDLETDYSEVDFDTFEASSDKQAIAIAVRKFNGLNYDRTEELFLETIWAGDIDWVLTHEDEFLENWL